MTRSSRWHARVSLMTALLVAASSSSGCYRHRRIEPSALASSSGSRPEAVEVTLRDETWARLERPELRGECIEGAVRECMGQSCEELQRTRGVRVQDTDTVEVRESAPEQVAIGLVAAVVVIAVTLAVVFAQDFNPLGGWR